ILVAASPTNSGAPQLLVPLLGPFLYAGNSARGAEAAHFLVVGALDVVGLAMVTLGLAIHRSYIVRDRAPSATLLPAILPHGAVGAHQVLPRVDPGSAGEDPFHHPARGLVETALEGAGLLQVHEDAPGLTCEGDILGAGHALEHGAADAAHKRQVQGGGHQD